MKALRLASLVDLVVLMLVAVAVFLPPRPFRVVAAPRTDAAGRAQLAFAEARVVARPDDGDAIYELTRRLADARQSDWAVQTAAVAAERARTSPSYWRALLAVSIAHVDRLEAKPALDYATQALAACNAAAATCPSWEQLRVELYQRHLDAGVRSGIDPRKNPTGFREAGEAALRHVRVTGSGIAPTPAPAPSAGSGGGSGSGSATP